MVVDKSMTSELFRFGIPFKYRTPWVYECRIYVKGITVDDTAQGGKNGK